MVTRALVSAGSIVALSLGTALPAFAFGDIDLAHIRTRSEAMQDATGRAMLMRSFASLRTGQRNLRRHMLGISRGVDYRVLNVSGDMRRRFQNVMGDLPPSLLMTGGNSGRGSVGGYPTSRSIREGRGFEDVYGVDDRNRDIPGEIESGSER